MIRTNLLIIFCIFIFAWILKRKIIFSYTPKKSKEIYNEVFAHRGFHISILEENTLEAYRGALQSGLAIEMDVRYLKKEREIVCFHDRYTKRLLGRPGKLSNYSLEELKKYFILGTHQSVPTLEEAFKLIDGNVTILIEVKDSYYNGYKERLDFLIDGYKGRVYFHTKNIITYFRLRKKYGDTVFWVLNPFRKRFDFVKGRAYEHVNLPKWDDILFQIEESSVADSLLKKVIAIESDDCAKDVIRKLWYLNNKYTTRVSKDHFLNTKKIAHRALALNSLKEQSKEAIEVCKKNGFVIEADFVWYQKSVRVYHDDSPSTKLGQPVSGAEKISLENSLTLREFIEAVDGVVPIIFDIKDYRYHNRRIEEELVKVLEDYTGEYVVQSFNPYAMKWFRKKYPNIIRGQVGHSLRGLRDKIPTSFVWAINFFLFYSSKPDFVVYDLDKHVDILSRFNNIVGLPVYGYAPKSLEETLPFKELFDGFICEDLLNKNSW